MGRERGSGERSEEDQRGAIIRLVHGESERTCGERERERERGS